MDTQDSYRDRWIRCTPDGIRIRGYYFPWGGKTVRYADIRAVQRVRMGLMSGQGRIWGTANPTVWASLDPGRTRKTEGLLLDVGKRVRPFITPDDPAAVAAVIRDHSGPEATDGDRVLM
ncbi:hypothetical protein SAMN05216223_11399 [Actinacidiphila yanglinensis]|uniref:PH domain-containing protein n=1 Tax=Actinacidiphila yanglinensis TaxID=310779 RepID=A0A1H6D9V2_9ACTN|nr:hypothetical protein [Actinacidiphila yanglinensis]SEG82171.1 hypothetical protein SAMN05216223_11399 [Actinacidiphila yanglinensis]